MKFIKYLRQCSFDAIIAKYNLKQPTVEELKLLGVRIPIKDPPPESIGLEATAEGFQQITKDDFDNISKQFYVYYIVSNSNK